MGIENCPTCKKKIAQENAKELKIGQKTYKFCSQTCADAFKEISKTHEEIDKERKPDVRLM